MGDRTYGNPFRPMSPAAARVAGFWFDVPGLEREQLHLPMPKGLLVGEQPKPGGNPKLPLWPWPNNSAGARLFRMSEMDLFTYFTRLARVNLSRDVVARWNPDWARRRANWVLTGLPDGARIVACGARARNAFGVCDWFEPERFSVDELSIDVVAIPHPSGRTREYNDAGIKKEAGRWIRWAAKLEEHDPQPR